MASKMPDAWDTVVFKADNILICKEGSILVGADRKQTNINGIANWEHQ